MREEDLDGQGMPFGPVIIPELESVQSVLLADEEDELRKVFDDHIESTNTGSLCDCVQEVDTTTDEHMRRWRIFPILF